jgi:hypothetical protein
MTTHHRQWTRRRILSRRAKKNAWPRPAQLSPDKIKLGDLRLVEPQKVWLFGLGAKAEGVCVLFEEAVSSGSPARRARLALVYDNDTAKTGNPGALQFITVLRWPE